MDLSRNGLKVEEGLPRTSARFDFSPVRVPLAVRFMVYLKLWTLPKITPRKLQGFTILLFKEWNKEENWEFSND